MNAGVITTLKPKKNLGCHGQKLISSQSSMASSPDSHRAGKVLDCDHEQSKSTGVEQNTGPGFTLRQVLDQRKERILRLSSQQAIYCRELLHLPRGNRTR